MKYVTAAVEGGKFSFTRSKRRAARAFKSGNIIGVVRRRKGTQVFDRAMHRIQPEITAFRPVALR